MKKTLALLATFIYVCLIACGPSAADQKAMEEQLKKAEDSAQNALIEQASKAATPDDQSGAKEKMRADSIHRADSLAGGKGKE